VFGGRHTLAFMLPAVCWPCKRYASCSTQGAAGPGEANHIPKLTCLRQLDTCRLIPSRLSIWRIVLAPLAADSKCSADSLQN